MSSLPDPTQSLETVSSCRICSGARFRLALQVDRWRLMQCDDCGIVFTSPRYTATALADLYRSAYYETANAYFATQSATVGVDQIRIARQAARYMGGRRGTTIDIGTGCGRLVGAFAHLGFQATGTDPSDAACSVARQHGRNVLNTDIADLPAERFDCVTAMHVLEHVPEPLPFVTHMSRIATPGGVVVIEVPNFASKKSRRLGAKYPGLYPSTHLFQFTPTTLRGVCQRAGLLPLATYRVGGAGVCDALALPMQPSGQARAQQGRKGLSAEGVAATVKRALWNARRPLLEIPGVRPLARWINWELLGYGEFVRIIARKPAS